MTLEQINEPAYVWFDNIVRTIGRFVRLFPPRQNRYRESHTLPHFNHRLPIKTRRAVNSHQTVSDLAVPFSVSCWGWRSNACLEAAQTGRGDMSVLIVSLGQTLFDGDGKSMLLWCANWILDPWQLCDSSWRLETIIERQYSDKFQCGKWINSTAWCCLWHRNYTFSFMYNCI